MKKIALVSTYCDTQEKKDIFLNLVRTVKSYGVDVIAISPLPLDKEHIEACDYVFFTKENPILTWPLRLFTFWKEYELPDGRIATMQRGIGDYGWAALYHVKKLTQIAMTYDYDIFYHMIYDLEIDDVVKDALLNFQGNIIYPRRDPHNPDTLWETTLHFISFDKDLMKKIEKEITLEEYLSTNGVAEGEVYKWKNKFDIEGSEHPVRDLIYYWKDYDFFNYSPVDDFKLFLSKNEEIDIWLGESPLFPHKLSPNLRLIFYGFSGELEITVIINNIRETIVVKPFEYFEFSINSKEVNKIEVEYNNQTYDITKSYNEISINQVYYNYKDVNTPFNISYGDEIRVESSNLEINYNSNNLPLKVVFQRQIGNKHLWESNLNSYSWVTFPNTEMVDTLIYDKNNTLIYRHNWNVENNGTFIYKKLFEYCFNNFQNGIQNNGIVVGTHNGEFGEWVPIATKKLSKILLIEASKSQFDDLVKNFNWNQELRFMNELITVDGEDTIFYEGGLGYTNTILKRVIEYWEKEPITGTRMKSIKFSDIISEDINWIHMDVEGIDYQLIMSLTDKQLSQLGIIIYEYNNSTPDERILIENFLKSKGFQTYNEDGVGMGYKL